jgi:hypothetical protein
LGDRPLDPGSPLGFRNKKKAFSTSPAVRQKILGSARQLGYVPDLTERGLNRQATRLIGMFASPATHVAEAHPCPQTEFGHPFQAIKSRLVAMLFAGALRASVALSIDAGVTAPALSSPSAT